MLNISNLICKDNPQRPQAQVPRPRPPSGPLAADGREGRPAGSRIGGIRSAGSRIASVLAIAAWLLVDRLASVPRRLCDRLFQMNDAEAYWRNWQIVKVHGGLGRRYRDPCFDTLTSCPRCRGTGIDARATGEGSATGEELS